MPGTSRSMAGLMAPGTHHAVILFFDNYLTLANLVYAGVLERHPRLRVGVLECGGGWIAHWMDRLDEFVESYGWQLSHLPPQPGEDVRPQAGASRPSPPTWRCGRGGSRVSDGWTARRGAPSTPPVPSSPQGSSTCTRTTTRSSTGIPWPRPRLGTA